MVSDDLNEFQEPSGRLQYNEEDNSDYPTGASQRHTMLFSSRPLKKTKINVHNFFKSQNYKMRTQSMDSQGETSELVNHRKFQD